MVDIAMYWPYRQVRVISRAIGIVWSLHEQDLFICKWNCVDGEGP